MGRRTLLSKIITNIVSQNDFIAKKLFIGLTFLFFNSCAISNNNRFNSLNQFNLKISQTTGASQIYVYYIKSDIFYINKVYITKYDINEKIIYKKRLSMNILDSVGRLSNPLFNIDSEYIEAQLGGIRWELSISDGQRVKKIVIENTKVEQVDMLFGTINTLIPKNKPKILREYTVVQD